MKVIIVGCGVMGSGIAIASIRAGYSTTLYDLNEDALQKAESYIHQQLKKAIEKGKMNDSQKDDAGSHFGTYRRCSSHLPFARGTCLLT